MSEEQLQQVVSLVYNQLKAEMNTMEARVADLETAQDLPLFYHKASLLVTDKDGNVVKRIELQPKTPVLRGGTLEYVGTPREGAITDSFRVTAGD